MRRLWVVLTLIAIFATPLSEAAEMHYFGAGIDYWQDQRATASEEAGGAAKPETTGSFDWAPYLDPGRDEFFREGDYLPPKPFMAVARDPSDDNIRAFLAATAAKNALAARLERRMQEFLGAAGSDPLARQAPLTDAQPLALERYDALFYFESTCPHCQRMAGEVQKLKGLGLAVAARQVDAGPLGRAVSSLGPIEPASKADLTRFNVSAVPLLVVTDRETQAVYRISGYRSADEVISLLKSRDRPPPP